jgi:hypothetical protein
MKEKRGSVPPGDDFTMNNTNIGINFFPLQFADPNIRLLKVRANSKEAVEGGWPTITNYSARSPEILQWVKRGGNYGITSPNGFLALVDADIVEIQKTLDNNLPITYRWSTGKQGRFQYGYFIQDGPIGCIPLKDGSYIKGKGGYALGPGSVHPNGVIYGSVEIRDVPIAIVKKSDLLAVSKDFIVGKETSPNRHKGEIPKGSGQILKVLHAYGVDISHFMQAGSWYKGTHPVHGSETGANFAINPETDTWHCFRHNTGGGVISLIAVLDGMIECKDVKGVD